MIEANRPKRERHQPQYDLRIEELRAFHDVIGQEVKVLDIISKDQAQARLDLHGTPEP